MISKSTYRKIIFFELMMIVILAIFIYKEFRGQMYSGMLQDYEEVQVGEYNGQNYHVYQCPAGTIVIEFEDISNE